MRFSRSLRPPLDRKAIRHSRGGRHLESRARRSRVPGIRVLLTPLRGRNPLTSSADSPWLTPPSKLPGRWSLRPPVNLGDRFGRRQTVMATRADVCDASRAPRFATGPGRCSKVWSPIRCRIPAMSHAALKRSGAAAGACAAIGHVPVVRRQGVPARRRAGACRPPRFPPNAPPPRQRCAKRCGFG